MRVTITSSHGEFDVDSETGRVIRTELRGTFGPLPQVVNTGEWHLRYPQERFDRQGSIDILDIGYWSADGVYTAPEESWRLEREASREVRILHREITGCLGCPAYGIGSYCILSRTVVFDKRPVGPYYIHPDCPLPKKENTSYL
jgi:hypothetical protein